MRSVAHESSLERDFVTLCRFDLDVIGVEEQPVSIHWTDAAGRTHRYTPDYRVVRRTGTDIVEVKYRADLKEKWANYRPAFAAARAWAAGQGMRFRIATDHGIRGPLLANAKRLLPRSHDPVDVEAENALLAALGRLQPVIFSSTVDAASGPGLSRARVLAALWALIARRHVQTALDREIGGSSLLWLQGAAL
jgi:hypothetical protein